jgi:uncharacterized protein
MLVSGTLVWSESLPGWSGEWHLHARDRDYVWRIAGVSYDDAFKSAARGVLRVAANRGAPE